MHLASAKDIRLIDQYAVDHLHLSTDELIHRSGEAVAAAVRRRIPAGDDVVVLAGAGNNGADGYAAACALSEYRVTVIDVFDHTSAYRTAFEKTGGRVLCMADELITEFLTADCLIDAIFGTGFHGDVPSALHAVCDMFALSRAYKIAVDLPLGIDADTGRVLPHAWRVDATVVLSFMKAGLVSYPARTYVGELLYEPIGLPTDMLAEHFPSHRTWIDAAFVREHLPPRPSDANKGTFGGVCMYTGSEAYRGAAHLSVSAALRSGVGYTHFIGTQTLVDSLLPVYPEVLYHTTPVDSDAERIIDAVDRTAQATLIGCGSGCTESLYRHVVRCLAREGGTLVLDADALNVLWQFGHVHALKAARRRVVLTPHPKEFSKLCGQSVKQIQADRLCCAEQFAKEYGVTLVLKGAGTIVTDGTHSYINSTGSSALSKAGSGDVLAGVIAALCAQTEPCIAAALAVYLHGAAADTLAQTFSMYGVTPSDLPQEIAKHIRQIQDV